MNAALIMLTSAWAAGAGEAPAPNAAPISPYGLVSPYAGPIASAPPAQPVPGPAAVVIPAPALSSTTVGSGSCGVGGCGGGCGTVCDTCDNGCGKGGLFSRFKGMWGGKKHHECDTCATTTCNTCAPAPVHQHATVISSNCGCDTCDNGCGKGKGGLFSRFKGAWGGKKQHGCDTCASACDTCGTASCGSSSCGTATIGNPVVPPAGMLPGTVVPGAPFAPGTPIRTLEPVNPPKKMPGKVSTGSPSVDAAPTGNARPIIEVGGPANPF